MRRDRPLVERERLFIELRMFVFNEETIFGRIFDEKEKDFGGCFFEYFLVICEELFFVFDLGFRLIVFLHLILIDDFEDIDRIIGLISIIVNLKHITKMIPNIIWMLYFEPNVRGSIVLDKSINRKDIIVVKVLSNQFFPPLKLR